LFSGLWYGKLQSQPRINHHFMKNNVLLAALLTLSSPAWADQTLSGQWHLLQRPVVAGCSLYISHTGLPSDYNHLVLNTDAEGKMAIVISSDQLPKLKVAETPIVFDFGHGHIKTMNALYAMDHFPSGDFGRLKARGPVVGFPIWQALSDHSTFSMFVPEADNFQLTVHTSQSRAALNDLSRCTRQLKNQSAPPHPAQ